MSQPVPHEPAGAATAADADGEQAVRRLPLSRIERRVAERLSHSRATIPDFTLELDADVTGLLAARAASQASPKPTLNDHVLHAVAATLAQPAHERLRGRFAGDAIEVRDRVHLGFAVATDRGLLVPVIHDADRLTLDELAQRTRALVDRARNGSIGFAELTAGVFSVTNLGMLGILRFQPVIDPDHAAILSVGSVRRELAPDDDGRPQVRARIALSISADHRVVDGVAAARFLADVRDRLEAAPR